MNERFNNGNQDRERQIETVRVAVTDAIRNFLELNSIPSADIRWDTDYTLGFSLTEPDGGESLLTGGNLQQELTEYLQVAEIPGLAQYQIDSTSGPGIISFTKIPNN